jgi:Cu+-exporting ATPase
MFEAISGKGVSVVLEEKRVLVGNRRLMAEEKISTKSFEEKISSFENDGKTVVIVAVNKEAVGLVAVADTLKESSIKAVKDLKGMGLEMIMLTGDNERTANAIAQQVGVERVIADVLPADKVNVVKMLQEEGKSVAMVGDGINDAPALAQADIGIAVGSGTDVAVETAGIVLIKDDLKDVPTSIKLSHSTMKKIKQNLFWAFFYNIGLIPVAATGLLNPILAAVAMGLSSVTVVTNSLTLKRFNPKKWKGKLSNKGRKELTNKGRKEVKKDLTMDPVCKMTVDENSAVATSTYEGKKYYFCNISCKVDFDKNPKQYI